MDNCTSGYLVTGASIVINGIHYHGVDTDAWPIGSRYLEEWFPEICTKALADLTFLLLLDKESALRYYTMCKNTKSIVRLLYCETLADHAETTITQQHTPLPCTFLGYDYAYPSGDYFSSVLNDVIYHRGYFSAEWKECLNSYGLFTGLNQIRAFVQNRKALINKSTYNNMFELGEFVIFRLFEIECYNPITEE